MTQPAYTLTEVLIVLIILAFAATLVASGSPAMFAHAALRQAAARLSSDLDLAAMRARGEGAFGELRIAADGTGYGLYVDGRAVRGRTLPRGIRLSASAPAIPA